MEGHRRITGIDQVGYRPGAVAEQEVEDGNVTGHLAGLIEHRHRRVLIAAPGSLPQTAAATVSGRLPRRYWPR